MDNTLQKFELSNLLILMLACKSRVGSYCECAQAVTYGLGSVTIECVEPTVHSYEPSAADEGSEQS